MSEPTPDDRPRPVPSVPVPSAPVPSAPLPGAPVPGAPVSGGSPQAAGAKGASDLGEHSTGDIVIDSALQDLRDAPSDDLDAQIEAGRRVHQTLQGRLSHLGGE